MGTRAEGGQHEGYAHPRILDRRACAACCNDGTHEVSLILDCTLAKQLLEGSADPQTKQDAVQVSSAGWAWAGRSNDLSDIDARMDPHASQAALSYQDVCRVVSMRACTSSSRLYKSMLLLGECFVHRQPTPSYGEAAQS